jgi:glycosyltransferase involved in cell wall biosynthesis
VPQPPLISVILPVKNAVPTIDSALHSVLTQTCPTFEVLAIDDGSTDGTSEKLHAAARGDPRVRVLSGSGSGTTAALIQGMASARGTFVARQDADDLSMPERFDRQVAFLDEHPGVCAVGTAALVVNEGGQYVGQFPARHGPSAVRAGLRNALITPVHGSMMMRRDCLAEVGGYRAAFMASQDFDLWTRLLERWDIDNLREPLYHWRVTPQSVYTARRRVQLMYGGIGLAFAAERRRYASDSYQLLESCDGDLELFARRYRLRGLLRAIWGDLLFRGTGDVRLARHHFGLALKHGHLRLTTLLLWGWTSCGLPWPGGKALGAQGTTRQAGRGVSS